jgi:hypothetical protein
MPPSVSRRRVAPLRGSSTRSSVTPRSPTCWTTRPAAVSRSGVSVPPTVQALRAVPFGAVIVTLVLPVPRRATYRSEPWRAGTTCTLSPSTIGCRPPAVGTSVVRDRLVPGATSVTTVPAGTTCTAARSPADSRTPGTGPEWPVAASMICGY